MKTSEIFRVIKNFSFVSPLFIRNNRLYFCYYNIYGYIESDIFKTDTTKKNIINRILYSLNLEDILNNFFIKTEDKDINSIIDFIDSLEYVRDGMLLPSIFLTTILDLSYSYLFSKIKQLKLYKDILYFENKDNVIFYKGDKVISEEVYLIDLTILSFFGLKNFVLGLGKNYINLYREDENSNIVIFIQKNISELDNFILKFLDYSKEEEKVLSVMEYKEDYIKTIEYRHNIGLYYGGFRIFYLPTYFKLQDLFN